MGGTVFFTWNDKKSKENILKHKVSFEEAQTAFMDENARIISDLDHSFNEDRYLLLGMSKKMRLLVVSHTYYEDLEVIRLISARRANIKELRQYEVFK
jgi:uncharacterized protein